MTDLYFHSTMQDWDIRVTDEDEDSLYVLFDHDEAGIEYIDASGARWGIEPCGPLVYSINPILGRGRSIPELAKFTQSVFEVSWPRDGHMAYVRLTLAGKPTSHFQPGNFFWTVSESTGASISGRLPQAYGLRQARRLFEGANSNLVLKPPVTGPNVWDRLTTEKDSL
jgi:hypothetical protein